MAGFNSKMSVSSALQNKKNKFNLSSSHITTMDFFQLKPTFVKEMIPGERCKIDVGTFCRLSPLVEPMFGKVDIVHRAFFVPMRTIDSNWQSFIEESPKGYNKLLTHPTHVTLLQDSAIIEMFIEHVTNHLSADTLALSTPQSQLYDVTWFDHLHDTNFKGKLTYKGKYFLNILKCLGYDAFFPQTSDQWERLTDTYSALPLLAYAKVFHDYYTNSQYNNWQVLESYFNLAPNSILNSGDLYKILDICYRMHRDSDYFNSAWDEPVGPNQTPSLNTIYFDDLTAPDNHELPFISNANDKGTPILSNDENYLNHITDYSLKVLHKFTDYVTRKRLSGVKSVDRYFTEFGVKQDNRITNMSYMFGKNEVNVQIGDVMQTAPDSVDGSSDSYGVGNYSGRGVAFDPKSSNLFDFTAPDGEYGFAIVLTYVKPTTMYNAGLPRYLQHKTRFDFFTPDFDNLGPQAVRLDELMSGVLTPSPYADQYEPDKIFGWLPRYAEYKVGRDVVSGDFNFRNTKESLKPWLLVRDFRIDNYSNLQSIAYLPDNSKHSKAFTNGSPRDLTRIFFDTGYDTEAEHDYDNPAIFDDHFFCYFRFNVESYAPMKHLFDWYDFDSEGHPVVMDVEGNKSAQL